MNTRELKNLTVNDHKYSYIEYTHNGVSYAETEFIQIPLTEYNKKYVKGLGGMMSRVFNDKRKEVEESSKCEVDKLTFLSLPSEYSKMLTVIMYEHKGKELGIAHVSDVYFIYALLGHVDELEDVKRDNGLNYKELPLYKAYFKDYKESTGVNNIGIKVNGEEVEYGDKIKITDFKGLNSLIEEYGSTGDVVFDEVIKEGNLKSFNIDIDESDGLMNSISHNWIEKLDGTPFTVYDNLDIWSKHDDFVEDYKGMTLEEVIEYDLKPLVKRIKGTPREQRERLEAKKEYLETHPFLFGRSLIKTIVEDERVNATLIKK